MTDKLEFYKNTVGLMIGLYCRSRHRTYLKRDGVCYACGELKTYCFLKLDKCIFGQKKPDCRNCPIHCFRPAMRKEIKEVMRYASPRMLLRHPVVTIKYLFHKLG